MYRPHEALQAEAAGEGCALALGSVKHAGRGRAGPPKGQGRFSGEVALALGTVREGQWTGSQWEGAASASSSTSW